MPEIEQSQVAGLEQVHFQTVRPKKMAIFNTSSTELKHLFISWVAISYAFAIMLAWMELDGKPTSSDIFGPFITDMFIISLVTVGISFIFHEMGTSSLPSSTVHGPSSG